MEEALAPACMHAPPWLASFDVDGKILIVVESVVLKEVVIFERFKGICSGVVRIMTTKCGGHWENSTQRSREYDRRYYPIFVPQ